MLVEKYLKNVLFYAVKHEKKQNQQQLKGKAKKAKNIEIVTNKE